MNSIPPINAAARKSATHAGNAILVLDGSGQVQMANNAACTLWQASSAELVGDYFPNLFIFEVTSNDPDWVQSQWEVLVSAAQDQPITLKLQPNEAAEIEVVVRIEKAGLDPVNYFAVISLPAPAVAPLVSNIPHGPAADHFLNQLSERSPLGFFDLNFQKSEVYYSSVWKSQLGYTDATLPNTYESWLLLIHPDDSAAAPDRQGRGNSTGTRQFSLEFRMRHAQGHYVWVQSAGVQVYGPNGALQRVIGAHLDIDDRKEFEEASARTDERLRQLGDRGRVGMFDIDFASGLYWLSPGFKSLLGYADGELPDTLESITLALPMDETAGGLQAYFLAQHPDQASYFDTLRLRHREGRELLVQAGIVRQISRGKELQRIIGFAVPLSQQSSDALAGQSLGIPASHLAPLLAELHEAVLFADAACQITFLNPKAEYLLGLTNEKAAGLSASEVFRLLHRKNSQPGESPVAKALATGEPMTLNDEFILDLGNGKTRPVTFSSRPVLGANSQPIGAVVVFRDPEEMALTPEELVRANRFEALGQAAGGIAHDFNNLLTTILGGVSVARVNHDYSCLENSERACFQAKALSKQLLTLAKGGNTVRQVLKTDEILADAKRLAAAGSAVKVDITVAPGTATVCVDRAQMLQVFQNLIINAVQAMPTGQGQIWITASNETLAEGQISKLAAGPYVAIQVRDNGTGIKPEHLEKIFDPFFTTKKTGTGLGLATVHSIVLRHAGQMGVDTELGVGTTFTVFLPPADKPEEIQARRSPSLNIGTGRILFMDDDEDICSLTGGMLESLGYKYDLAHNGEEAVQLYKRYLNIGRPYDAIITDLTIIGGMGGEQTFKVLRELHPEVNAIMASGYDNDEMANQFIQMGFCGYLSKPYRVNDLGKILSKVLGK